jgi:hypothetical protein
VRLPRSLLFKIYQEKQQVMLRRSGVGTAVVIPIAVDIFRKLNSGASAEACYP